MFTNKQQTIPTAEGIIIASIIHFQLPVSFFIVKHVVPHGKWNREKIIVHIAVVSVQPLSTNNIFNIAKSSISTNIPVSIYVIIIIGITISFAGNPKINAIRITPSNPINFANGSKKSEQYLIRDISLNVILLINHIISPAGIAITIALPNTKKVLSKIDLTITFTICGFLYGGNSKINDEGNPFKTVLDKIFDTINIIIIPNNITPNKISAEATPLNAGAIFPTKNIDIIVINVGKRPLHGTKLLVRIAINLSRGESIILVPITPHVLHPKPIQVVSACLPCADAFLNKLSRLKAIRGKYPKSSSKVNNGKKIAIGGSITDTTQANVLYIPCTIIPINHCGKFALINNTSNLSPIIKKQLYKIFDG